MKDMQEGTLDKGEAGRNLEQFSFDNFDRQKVVGFSFAMASIFTIIAWLIASYAIKKPVSDVFLSSYSVFMQIITGVITGGLLAVVSLKVAFSSARLSSFREIARMAFENIKPRKSDMLVVALFAGWSEELLFRGIIQPLAGIWLTSLLFVIIHGAVDVRDKSKRAFAMFVFTGSLIMGLMYSYAGLAAAMAAHAAYDLFILIGLSDYLPKTSA